MGDARYVNLFRGVWVTLQLGRRGYLCLAG